MRVAGGDRSLAGKAAEFQRLALEKEFADKMLASAMSTLELARNEAQRQQLYLERVAQPSLPDQALEPRRIRNIASVLVLGLISWGVLGMLIAGIREHQD
jgi:capsular polysaccharide transport system permease protein